MQPRGGSGRASDLAREVAVDQEVARSGCVYGVRILEIDKAREMKPTRFRDLAQYAIDGLVSDRQPGSESSIALRGRANVAPENASTVELLTDEVGRRDIADRDRILDDRSGCGGLRVVQGLVKERAGRGARGDPHACQVFPEPFLGRGAV